MTKRIYTRTGDGGETGLFRGGRVSKSALRVEAYGTVDELVAALGLVIAHQPPPAIHALLTEVQASMFELGADLATPPEVDNRSGGVTEADIERIERAIDGAEEQLPPLKSFILPGGARAAAALHLARAICRRAERRCVALREAEPATSELAVKLLNRVSDLLFVLARLANQEAGVEDPTWQAR